jgi:hypothetical protein
MKLCDIERFEIVAAAFRSETGHWPPGKDASAAMNQTEEAREVARAAWYVWNERNDSVIRALLRAVETVCEER